MKLLLKASSTTKKVSGSIDWADGSTVDLGEKDSLAFVDTLVKSTNPKMGVLPPAVRWISSDKRVLVFERPPSYQRVAYYEMARDEIDPEMGSDGLREFLIPLPWTVYVLGFGYDFQPITLRAYMRRDPIETLDDCVYLLPLLNFYTNSKLCNPIFEKYEAHEPSVSAGIHLAYNAVWNSGFNYDLVDAMRMGMQSNAPFAPNIDKFPHYQATNANCYFANWQEHTTEQALNCNLINPSIGENGSSNSEAISVATSIGMVTAELYHHMGSQNLAKNFITSLVNNFSIL